MEQRDLILAKTLNKELRNEFLRNRRRTNESSVMQPPHLTVAVQAQKESEKD